MTLNTRVFVLDEIPYPELFAKCNQLIGAHEGIRFTDDGESIWNTPGQGLCALLDVQYKPVADGERARWCEPGDPDESHTMCFPRRAEVSFDTGYGYRGESGEGCGDLHARLVAELGRWLDERGVRWRWMNEFTGEVWDRYEHLSDLGDAGEAARSWMVTSVYRAIGAQIASEQD